MEDIRFLGKPEFEIKNPGFVSVLRNQDFVFEYKKGKKWHSFIYVERGGLEYHFNKNEKNLVVNKGDLLFVPRKLPYKTTYLRDCTLLKIFTFDISNNVLPEKFSTPFILSEKTFHDIFSDCTRTNTRNTFFLFSKIYMILNILQNSEKLDTKISKKILPALREIQNKFYENKKISYYADLCKMSESNFRKLFKEQTGNSPIEYRNTLRIAEAKRLIDSGEYTVAEAAYAAGFNNMSFFYEIHNKRF